MTKHPGKTPAQRRVLDEIGCGNHSPMMTRATRDKLVRDGLIYKLAPYRHGIVLISQYEMPIVIHMQWCKAVAEEVPGDL